MTSIDLTYSFNRSVVIDWQLFKLVMTSIYLASNPLAPPPVAPFGRFGYAVVRVGQAGCLGIILRNLRCPVAKAPEVNT